MSLSQVYLVELLSPGAEAPPAAQTCGASGLARMRKPRLDLVLEDVAHVDLEGRLLARKTPRLLRLMGLAGLRKSQRVARARIGRIKRDKADAAAATIVSIGDGGIEWYQHVNLLI